MSGARDSYARLPGETEAQRLRRLDGQAIRTYTNKRHGGGGMTRRYYQHLNDEPDKPAAKSNKNDN